MIAKLRDEVALSMKNEGKRWCGRKESELRTDNTALKVTLAQKRR
jgi:hypothetical protein